MKRVVYSILLIACMVALVACKNEADPKISLNASALELEVGEVFLLEAMVENATTAPVWQTDNPIVLSLLSGVITALQEGTATVTATVAGVSASCFVVVKEKLTDTPENNNDNLTDALRALPKSSKRGVGYGSPFFAEDVTILSPTLAWAYNWGPDLSSAALPLFEQGAIDFVPMAWNAAYDKERIRTYVATHPACKYLLAFNEPNLTDQCNYTPQQAASYWGELKAFADELNLKIVSPAMNYGTLAGYSDPVKWLDEFFSLVPLEDVSAIALHCYMGSAGALKSFVDRFDKYGKPVWMTEFCAWENVSGVEAQMDYMSETILMMEADPRIERYAWFLPRGNGSLDRAPYNQLLTKTSPITLSPLGCVFAGLSSFDCSVWLDPEKHVLMNTCSAICTLADNDPVASPHFRPAQAEQGHSLQMNGFSTGKWIEFQIEAQQDLKRFRLSHSAYLKTQLQLLLDGQPWAMLELPRAESEDVWNVSEIDVNLPAGRHVLRLQNVSGNTNLHWFNIK